MEGKVNFSGKTYEWWAGQADPDADGEYCVHCRCGDYGVTRYLDRDPDKNTAEDIARKLIPSVQQLN